jgi:hypothetical protein
LEIAPPPAGWRPVPGGELYKDILRDYYDLELAGAARQLPQTRSAAEQVMATGEPSRVSSD